MRTESGDQVRPVWALFGLPGLSGMQLYHAVGGGDAGPVSQVRRADHEADRYQPMCEKNAASEGVATRCRFQHGDAHQLDFPDDTFDAVVSNYVYHNITGADKQALLRETLRVLKPGGVFALNDDMKPRMYGDMEAFAQDLREAGFQEVRLVDTATEVFGSQRRAAMMMLGESRMLVGRK